MDLDIYGNPIGTKYSGDGDCPEDMMCIPVDEFHMQLEEAGMEYDETSMEIQPVGDAEAIIDFTQTLLTLDFWTLVSFSIPLTIMAVYGLTIYAGVKWIQRRFS